MLGGAEILLVRRAGPVTPLTAGADVRCAPPPLPRFCGALAVLGPRRGRPYAVVGVLAALASWVGPASGAPRRDGAGARGRGAGPRRDARPGPRRAARPGPRRAVK